MKITKSIIPKREERIKKKKEKTWTSHFDSINPEKIILKNILQKNSSLRSLKDKIQKESNNNMHEILSSDESRLKAIKYVINASKGKENQKNYINQNQKNNTKMKKNLSFLSCDIPVPGKIKNENKIKVKRSQRIINNKIEKISPIKNDKNKNKFFNDDKPLNEEDLLRDNNMLSNKKEKNYIVNSSSDLIPINKLYDLTSQREVNLQFIQPRNKYDLKNNNKMNINSNNQNNFYESQKIFKEINPSLKQNFFQKIKYVKTIDNKERSPKSDYNYQSIITDNNIRNKTINNFYIHKQINKSALYVDNKIKANIINNYNISQEKKNNYLNKNNSYDIKFNLRENYNHKKYISQDGYYNLQIQKNLIQNQNPFYITEVNSFYEPKNNKMNYINNSTKLRFLENINNNNNNKKKNIIRIMNNNQIINDLNINNNSNNFYLSKNGQKAPIKRKNNSFFIGDTIPIKINQYNDRDYNETDYNKNVSKNNINNNLYNDFSFNKKISPNYNNKTTFSANNDNSSISNENKENTINNRILVKKRPLKESFNFETLYANTKPSIKKKTNRNKLYICENKFFSYISKNKNKIIFNNENEIVEYINKKFEENKKDNIEKKLKYTGYILTKKYKGKILYEIRFEDDMNKLNNKLKEENIRVGNEIIEIINIKQKEEYIKLKNNIENLQKEIDDLKQENESLSKKDYLKNELIKKLDKEKQNIIKENEKMSNELENIKKINNNLNHKIKEILSKNIIKQYNIEKILTLNFESIQKNEKIINKTIEKEKIEINKTPISNKNNNNSNNISINWNISNSEVEIDSKKSNPLSVFRLSKISEIKIIKNDNMDSGDKEIKNNLALLNGQSKNNNGEINSFNENDNEK